MSEHDEALKLLRERFPEPWEVGVHQGRALGDWSAFAATPGNDDVQVQGYGATPLLAARACIAAWDEATRREVMPCNCAELDAARARVAVLAAECRAWRAWDDYDEDGASWDAVESARAATDAAGALEVRP